MASGLFLTILTVTLIIVLGGTVPLIWILAFCPILEQLEEFVIFTIQVAVESTTTSDGKIT